MSLPLNGDWFNSFDSRGLRQHDRARIGTADSGGVVHGDVSCGDRRAKPDNDQGGHALFVLSALANCLEKSADTLIAFEDCLRKRVFSPSPERGRCVRLRRRGV